LLVREEVMTVLGLSGDLNDESDLGDLQNLKTTLYRNPDRRDDTDHHRRVKKEQRP